MATGTLGSFTLDKAGGEEVLRVLSAQAITDLGMQVLGAAGPDATITTSVTKSRFVATIKVPADQQAKDGVLSKAAAKLGLEVRQYSKKGDPTTRKRVIGFVSRRQWRWAFVNKQPWALGKARETPGEKVIRYRNLPEATGKNSSTTTVKAPRKRGRPRNDAAK